MAITITQQPTTYAPAYSPMIVKATSTNIAQPGFQFVVQILINGKTITLLVSPNPSNILEIDIHRIVEAFVSVDIKYSDNFIVCSNSYVYYQVRIGEFYNNTQYLNLANFNAYGFNAIVDYVDLQNGFNVDNYLVDDIKTNARFLTNAPGRRMTIKTNQKAYLHYILTSSAGGADYRARIKTYNGATLLNTYEWADGIGAIGTDKQFRRIACGTEDIIANGGNITNVTHYTVEIGKVPGFGSYTKRTEAFTFIIDDVCTKYKTYRIHFLNKLGGFDAFNFTLKDTIITEVQRKQYERLPSNEVSTTGVLDYGRRTINVDMQERYIVEANWLEDDEFVWLKELITSPICYLETDNATTPLVPIIIRNTSYETKKSNPASKLNQFAIEFELANTNTRQRF
jgi:hypothetical protein